MGEERLPLSLQEALTMQLDEVRQESALLIAERGSE